VIYVQYFINFIQRRLPFGKNSNTQPSRNYMAYRLIMVRVASYAWTEKSYDSFSTVGLRNTAARAGFGVALLLGSLASTSVPIHAQEAEAPAAAPAQTSPATVTPADQPQVKSTRFDDWYYRCVDVKAADGSTVAQCEVAQVAQVRQGDKDVSVLTLAIARTAGDSSKQGEEAEPGLLMTALVPLNVFLPDGFAIGADGKTALESAYRNCNQAGCWAQQRLDSKTVNLLKKANSGEGRMRLMNGQNVSVQFSLKGLTAALNELQKSGS
jgi:invasion protein IalB